MNVRLVICAVLMVATPILFSGCNKKTENNSAQDEQPATDQHEGEHHDADGDHHEEGTEDAEHGHSVDESAMQARADELASYDAAMQHIGHLRGEISELIESEKLSEVHPPAQEISIVAKRLPELASKSGIPRSEWKTINEKSRDLANLFSEIDEAADAGKKDETVAAFSKMGELIDALKMYKAEESSEGHAEEESNT